MILVKPIFPPPCLSLYRKWKENTSKKNEKETGGEYDGPERQKLGNSRGPTLQKSGEL